MPPSLTFRVLSAPIERKVLQAFRRNANWADDQPEQMQDALRGAEQAGTEVQWVTVESKRTRIAIARLELAAPQFCHVSDLIVLSAHRGRGVGEWFMEQIEQHCLAHGIPRLLLQPRAEAQGFYDKLHFTADPYVPGFLKKEISAFRPALFSAGRRPVSPW